MAKLHLYNKMQRKKSRVWKKVVFIIGLSILVLNALFYVLFASDFKPITDLSYDGVILKNNITKTVYIFSHGRVREEYQGKYYHQLLINKKWTPTKVIIDNYKKQGYKKFWLTACETNIDCIYKNNNFCINWTSDIDRANKDTVIPIFIGIGVVRI